MNGLTLDFFAVFFAESLRITFFGYEAMPATKQCPYGRSLVPSSKFRTMTAFLPAKRPCKTMTALFGFKNFTIEDSKWGRCYCCWGVGGFECFDLGLVLPKNCEKFIYTFIGLGPNNKKIDSFHFASRKVRDNSKINMFYQYFRILFFLALFVKRLVCVNWQRV